MSEADPAERTPEQEAIFRADWLSDHQAPAPWVIMTVGEVQTLRATITDLRNLLALARNQLHYQYCIGNRGKTNGEISDLIAVHNLIEQTLSGNTTPKPRSRNEQPNTHNAMSDPATPPAEEPTETAPVPAPEQEPETQTIAPEEAPEEA